MNAEELTEFDRLWARRQRLFAQLRRSAPTLTRRLALLDATWEPHDWSEWGEQ